MSRPTITRPVAVRPGEVDPNAPSRPTKEEMARVRHAMGLPPGDDEEDEEPDDTPAPAVLLEQAAEIEVPTEDPYAVDAPAPGPVIDCGDLAESIDAYQRHRDALAAAYRVRGPVEEMLLDRVVDLSWRLQRLQRVERGAIGIRTSGLMRTRLFDRIRAGREGPATQDEINAGALLSTNPERMNQVAQKLRQWIEAIELREEPSVKEGLTVLGELFGWRDDQHLAGKGDVLGMLYHQMIRRVGKELPEDHPDTSASVEARLRAYILEELRSVDAAVTTMVRQLRSEGIARDRATAEARGIPEGQPLKDFVAYERHLGAELRQARNELERVVARRRLGEAGRLLTALPPTARP